MKNAIKPSGIPMFCYCVGCRKKIFDLSVLLSFEHKGILCHDCCYYKKREEAGNDTETHEGGAEMTLRDFEQHVVRCCVVKKEFSEKKHIMEAISGLAIKANKLRDYLDLTSDYGTEGILNVVSDYEKKAIREALGEVLFDFVYLYKTLGIPIEEIMDATEGGMK